MGFSIWDFGFSSSLLFQFSPNFFLFRIEDGNMNLSPAALKFVIFQKDKRSHEIYGSYFTYTPIINMRCFCSAVTKGNRRKSLLIHGWFEMNNRRRYNNISALHIVWKLLKMSHLNFSILAFSTNFCPIETDLSGNTVWPQAPGFQKLAKMDHFWHF